MSFGSAKVILYGVIFLVVIPVLEASSSSRQKLDGALSSVVSSSSGTTGASALPGDFGDERCCPYVFNHRRRISRYLFRARAYAQTSSSDLREGQTDETALPAPVVVKPIVLESLDWEAAALKEEDAWVKAGMNDTHGYLAHFRGLSALQSTAVVRADGDREAKTILDVYGIYGVYAFWRQSRAGRLGLPEPVVGELVSCVQGYTVKSRAQDIDVWQLWAKYATTLAIEPRFLKQKGKLGGRPVRRLPTPFPSDDEAL